MKIRKIIPTAISVGIAITNTTPTIIIATNRKKPNKYAINSKPSISKIITNNNKINAIDNIVFISFAPLL